jgi:HEAT repeat protein
MGDRRLQLLKNLTKDSDPAVREEAAKAIERIEAENRTPPE